MSDNKVNGFGGPVRVFVGASAGGEDAEACAVLEASLRRRASAPVEIEWLRLSRAPGSFCAGWRTERWATPWTALRWAVPAICGWRGRAVYLDCPQIVLGDVAHLIDAPMPAEACVLVRREGAQLRVGCLVFDCAAARKWLPDLAALRADVGAHQTVGYLLSSHQNLTGDLPAGWGMRDIDFSRAPEAATGSVHMEAVALQPHQERARRRLRRAGREHWYAGPRLPHYSARLVALFEEEYAAAERDGYRVELYVPDEAYGPYSISGADRIAAV